MNLEDCVCLEAMAAGRAVICLDLGGPAQQVTPETGFKIPAHDPIQVVAALATAMTQIATSEDLRLQMGNAGRQRVKHYYSWEAQGRDFANTYATLISEPNSSQIL